MAKIIEARVRQKKDTLENWNNNPLVLLNGEQAFVLNANGREVNYKIGDGSRTFAELEFMIRYDQAAFVRVSSSDLPASDGGVHYSIVNPGVYNQVGAPNISVPEGYIGLISNDGASWYLDSLVESKGEKGDRGEPGSGLQPTGSVPSYADLSLISPTPEIGDSYVVNEDGLLYIYGELGFPPQGEGIEFINKSVYANTEW